MASVAVGPKGTRGVSVVPKLATGRAAVDRAG
jgi:hypothetical protein